MRTERTLPLIAIVFLILGCLSTVYVYATTNTQTTITINNHSYTYDQLSFSVEHREIETHQGIALDALIQFIGAPEPSTHTYTVIGADGYQKTVTWDNLKHGLLTSEREVIFSDLPKAFRVKEVVQIEVI